jgi:molybdenum cofactor cytidylyltransferase
MRNENKIAAVVLAAGLSRRMGKPKMILPWKDTTVIGQVIGAIRAAAGGEIVVVTGGAREMVEAEIEALDVRAVFNADHQSGGMMSSLRCGLGALDRSARAALIALGDHPQVETDTIQKIIAAWTGSPGAILVPSYRMKRGHPILIGRDHWSAVLNPKANRTLKDFLNAHAKEIHYVEIDNDSILSDLDTPEDYERHHGV